MQARTTGAPGPLHDLIAHPAGTAGPVAGLSVSAFRPEPSVLALDYVLSGDLFQVLVPTWTGRMRADDLWRHTCFEAFVRAGSGPGYHEVNLSPSGEWAVYGFEAYREGRTSPDGVESQTLVRASDDDQFAMTAIVRLDGLDPAVPWSIGLSAVVEVVEGGTSYWALTHPSASPDFHHPDSFTLTLPPPEPA
ncbi:DOMON-like domain-containing protein [uncultured Brevundimonas sp.]|uniref:DOMON-like domain-containing protein n=1 Tax=uncultured Brevundimonas sp. TaxID=213418 RepID=UPI0030EB3603|tara:strand:+ start:86356 stop:86931 length:576 start_codon:yes stop_codon:yes gene_type:complete